MAIRMDITTDDLATVTKELEAAGEKVEVETDEEPLEAAPKAELEIEGEELSAEKPIEAASPTKAKSTIEKPKKEEIPKAAKTKEELEWDALPQWAKNRINKLTSRNRELRDRVEDERAVERPTVRQPASVLETDKSEDLPPLTYSGKREPQFEDFEKADDPYRDFAKAHSLWAKEEAVAQVRYEEGLRRFQAAQQQMFDAFDKRQAEASKLVPDYDEVLEEATDVIASGTMTRIIQTSEVGPHLLYYFAQHPDECKRIHDLNPDQTMREMHRLEARVEVEVEKLKAHKPAHTEPPKRKAATVAPPPETPLRGTPPKPTGEESLANDRIIETVLKPNADYQRARQEQRRGR